MVGIVQELCHYPLKGTRGNNPRYLAIDPKIGVVGDRYYAVRRIHGNLQEWAPKTQFRVGMNTPQMVAEMPVFQERLGHKNMNRIEPSYLRDLGSRLRVEGELEVQDTEGEYSLCDTKGAFVSFLNLASVKALSEFVGQEVDPRRFRMNVWLTNLAPFEELEWVSGFPGTREIQVGLYRFRVDDACERCQAIEANPVTGVWDTKLLKALGEMMGKRGYKSPHRGTPIVMGILTAPLNRALIVRGDKVPIP